MPVTLSQLVAQEATAIIDSGVFAGSPINVTYNPNKISTNLLTQMDEGLDGTCAALAQAIKSWDLVDDEGAMYPITGDSLKELGATLLREIRGGILDDLRGQKSPN